MPVRGSGGLVSSWSLLISGILAALRQKLHLSTCPNFASHLLLSIEGRLGCPPPPHGLWESQRDIFPRLYRTESSGDQIQTGVDRVPMVRIELNDRKPAASKVLLIPDVLVRCNEDGISVCLGSYQQLAVRKLIPPDDRCVHCLMVG
jgi:hypothetical protein